MITKWYIVQVYSNFEKKVAEAIEREAQKKDLEHYVEQIFIPAEKVTEVRRGKRVDVEKKFFPGYVLVKANLTDEVFHLIKSIPKVTGFLGSATSPLPISDQEAQDIIKKVDEGVQVTNNNIVYDVGEEVRVTDGPFVNFTGIVQEVEDARTRLKVEVSIFGRSTPVDLDFNQVEKI